MILSRPESLSSFFPTPEGGHLPTIAPTPSRNFVVCWRHPGAGLRGEDKLGKEAEGAIHILDRLHVMVKTSCMPRPFRAFTPYAIRTQGCAWADLFEPFRLGEPSSPSPGTGESHPSCPGHPKQHIPIRRRSTLTTDC